MPAAKSKVPNPDTPLRKLAPSGDWIGQEPTAYAVRARDAEEALDLAVYCHVVSQGKIPPKYAKRVAHSFADLSEQPSLRTFRVLVGKKLQGGKPALATEIAVIDEQPAGIQ
jgi:hypothetical protein